MTIHTTITDRLTIYHLILPIDRRHTIILGKEIYEAAVASIAPMTLSGNLHIVPNASPSLLTALEKSFFVASVLGRTIPHWKSFLLKIEKNISGTQR